MFTCFGLPLWLPNVFCSLPFRGCIILYFPFGFGFTQLIPCASTIITPIQYNFVPDDLSNVFGGIFYFLYSIESTILTRKTLLAKVNSHTKMGINDLIYYPYLDSIRSIIPSFRQSVCRYIIFSSIYQYVKCVTKIQS